MATRTSPFAAFEWMIAWRYLRAKRSEGGVSIMTWISLAGITLAVFALIAVMAVRAGFREEFVGTILGVDAHVTVYSTTRLDESGREIKGFPEADPVADRLLAIPGVVTAAPLIRGQVMATFQDTSRGADIYGIRAADLAAIPRVGAGAEAYGDLSRFDQGVAMGSVLARNLGLTVGDKVRLINPNGARTPMGTSPRVNAYEVVYVFTAGRYAVDETRIYMPMAEAQPYFNREGFVDEFAVTVADAEAIDSYIPAILQAAPDGLPWTWRDAAGAFLNALDIEDNMMCIIMSILVLIASLNIISGLIMLVKNKGSDIGILRTMGLTEGSILRVFFICGASTGLIGTALGVILGCLFAIYIDPIFAMVNALSGGGIWDPSVRSISFLPAKLQFWDVARRWACLGIVVPCDADPGAQGRRGMNPVEALRYA